MTAAEGIPEGFRSDESGRVAPRGEEAMSPGIPSYNEHDLEHREWEMRATRGEQHESLVPPIRIERTTNGLGNRCSIQLSYGGVA